MKEEDKKFLKELQHEMLTQDKVCQASPRFWVVMQTVRDYWVDDDIDGTCIYDTDAAENVFEGDLREEIIEWLKNLEGIKDCKLGKWNCVEFKYNDEEYFINDKDDLKYFLDQYDDERYSVCFYRDREEIVPDTMFLTIRECKEHIEKNHYHYNKPHTYAMTAWRSPQVEKLYKILENTNWDEV